MLIASFILPNLLVAGHAVSTEEVQEHQHNFVSSQCQECGEYQYNITLYILKNDYVIIIVLFMRNIPCINVLSFLQPFIQIFSQDSHLILQPDDLAYLSDSLIITLLF